MPTEREEQMEHDMEGLRRENKILWERNVELLRDVCIAERDLRECIEINQGRK